MTESNQKLDGLFQAYRDAVTVPGPGVHFMPELWTRIEARRAFAARFARITQFFAGAAAVLGLVFVGYVALPSSTPSMMSETYIDILADEQPTENLLAQGIARMDREAGR